MRYLYCPFLAVTMTLTQCSSDGEALFAEADLHSGIDWNNLGQEGEENPRWECVIR